MIIDTDAGIDDAIALMMALTHPEVEVLAITTVTGNVGVERVTSNVGLVLDVLKRGVPIYQGSSLPLIDEPVPSETLMGEDGLGNASRDLPDPRHTISVEPAALALIRLSSKAQKEAPFTLVAVGPLTNLALAIRLDPTFASRVPRLVIMGGAMEAKGNATPVAEFNFYADAEAAVIVMEAGFPEIWVLPWETSLNNLLLWPDHQAITQIKSPQAAFFTRITAHLIAILKDDFGLPGMPLPDPLAMAVALNPDIAKQAHHVPVAVETGGRLSRGLMAVDWHHVLNKAPNAHIVSEVDFDAVQSLLHSCFNTV